MICFHSWCSRFQNRGNFLDLLSKVEMELCSGSDVFVWSQQSTWSQHALINRQLFYSKASIHNEHVLGMVLKHEKTWIWFEVPALLFHMKFVVYFIWFWSNPRQVVSLIYFWQQNWNIPRIGLKAVTASTWRKEFIQSTNTTNFTVKSLKSWQIKSLTLVLRERQRPSCMRSRLFAAKNDAVGCCWSNQTGQHSAVQHYDVSTLGVERGILK